MVNGEWSSDELDLSTHRLTVHRSPLNKMVERSQKDVWRIDTLADDRSAFG